MAGNVVIKSKTNKATKVALWLALILIFMMVLILFSQSGVNGEGEGTNLNKILLVLIIVSSVWFFASRKKRNTKKTQYDIIELVADNE
ncbi:MAG: hypothetical protein KAJ55_04700, partial [Anaerolineales bacterium]|nr:hypothetical protein [Anaerolineales bacterium]